MVSQPHTSPISLSAIDFSAQGKFLAAAGQAGTLKVFLPIKILQHTKF
ncbi:MAG: hypothetical protein GVY04_14445 [Cyanobacteria bacterium]|jgi:hypothetical protein|nr:hypothetical protein [Cyanobacteria bacterium GSL.Bin1]